jgi:hypothetical protein
MTKLNEFPEMHPDMSREELLQLAHHFANMVGGWEGLPKIQVLRSYLRRLENAQDRLEFLKALVDVAWEVYEDRWSTRPFVEFATRLLREEYEARGLL